MAQKAIGNRMRQIGEYVTAHPGCTPLEAAESLVYPGGGTSRRHGYSAIGRAIAAGLIYRIPRTDKRGCYRLHPLG